jgi:ATP phosphoribosyltransferase regulatory subunit
LSDHGVDTGAVRFDATFGLTSLEYYTGFVFGFAAPGHAPVATGGRYDLLTEAMSGGAKLPAVGGVIRPEVLLAIREGRA